MAKYRNKQGLEDLEKSIEQDIAAQQSAEPEIEAVGAEEETFKKRYGDLRRHTQTLLQQKDQEIANVRQQLETAAKGQIRFPKTDEEIDAWSKKYPDVAKIVDTIAQKRAGEVMDGLRQGEERLRKLETQLTRKDAEQQLLRMHPDFAQIRQDPAFHEWVQLQPSNIQDALYKNNTDARAAARAIDLYKIDTKKSKSSNKSAAQAVGPTSSTPPPANGNFKYSESMVDKMSSADFAKHEEAIIEAMSSGKFLYDLSGAAR